LNAEGIAEALKGHRSGAGWMAQCPAHEDRNPSLSIAEADGKVLVNCHAGCPQDDVIAALRDRGLWPEAQHSEAERLAYGQAKRSTGDRRIVAEYDYTDEAGALLYQTVRYEPKDFRQRRPDGCGGWIWKKGARQVLYRLPEVLNASTAFVVEGEKDVESLRYRGFVATTAAGGAKAPWLPAFTEALRGRVVVILPDADRPGREKALTIARALWGVAASIIVLELPDAKDISEWFEQGHSETELVDLADGTGITQ
jgi:5S rRNA maturation endonuclease (ribonuclease M5)